MTHVHVVQDTNIKTVVVEENKTLKYMKINKKPVSK